MPHTVDGYDLTFTSRRSWKANRHLRGRLVDVVPVTWTKGRRQDPASNEVYQEVWFQDSDEMEARRTGPKPFIVALAIAKDYNVMPHAFDEFRGLFEVVATGKTLSTNSIETRVLRRDRAPR